MDQQNIIIEMLYRGWKILPPTTATKRGNSTIINLPKGINEGDQIIPIVLPQHNGGYQHQGKKPTTCNQCMRPIWPENKGTCRNMDCPTNKPK